MSAAMQDCRDTPLSIPALPDDVDALTAALAYAAAGWYLVPVRRGTKHPGSVLGDHWPALSSRDREVIVSWFAGTDHGIALHVGRSGAVVFDIDTPEKAPITLRSAERECNPPTQRTRSDQRRHLVFAVPPGRTLSNQRGKLGIGWGEVRGTNGVIIVAPSVHPSGGHYRWVVTGAVPMLPRGVADMLPDAGPGEAAADSATVAEFARRYGTGDGSKSINGPLRTFADRLDEGDSRHEALVAVACWACREARAGAYPAAEARARLREAFVLSMAHAKGEARLLPPQAARYEFDGMWAWAVGQALVGGDEEDEPVVEAVTEVVVNGAEEVDEEPAEAEDDDSEDGEEWTLEELAARRRARLIAEELEKLEIREEAARLFRAAQRSHRPRIDDGLLDDLDAIELPAMLLGALIPDQAVGFLTGRSGGYKSFLATSWGCCIATGRPWLARTEFGIARPLKTLYVAAEGAAGAAARIKAWEAQNETSRAGKLLLYPRPVHLNDRGQAEELAEVIAARGIEFLIVDTYHRSAPGSEENSSTEFGVVFEAVAAMRDDHGCGVLFLDHTGHGGERTRGTSAKEDDADFVLIASYQGSERGPTVQRTLKVRKLKDQETDTEWPIKLIETVGAQFPVVTIGELKPPADEVDDWTDQLKWPLPGDVMTMEPKPDKDGSIRGRKAIGPLAMFMRQNAPDVERAVGITRAEAIREVKKVTGFADRTLANAWSALVEAGRLRTAEKVTSAISRHVWMRMPDDPRPV